jgi:hypothetical protein
MRLTDKELAWLFEYVRSMENASQAARVAYGGTPISVRVKGHKKKVKLRPILDRIDKIWDGLLEMGPDGWKKTSDEVEGEVDRYLKRLEKRQKKQWG